MVVYDKWQEEVLNHDGDLLVNTGRQVGKTMVFSHKIARFMLSKPDSRVIVVSMTEDQAKLIIVMVLDYLEKNAKREIVTSGPNKKTTSRIWLKNGSSVISRPVGNTGDAVRGFTGDVLYIDEAAYMPELMWKAAMPTLATTGGQLWLSSTPAGKFVNNTNDKNFFFKSWENLDNRWKIVTVVTEDVYKNRAFSDEWTEEKRDKALRFIDNQKQILTEMEFRQEYCGEFLDDNRQWFPDELIRKCMEVYRPERIDSNKSYYLGIDVARMGDDESSFEIFYMTDEGLVVQVENQVTTKTTLDQTFSYIKILDEKYDFKKIIIDSEGIGVGIYDFLMSDDQTKNKTVGIKNSTVVNTDGREELQNTVAYSNLKLLMEQGKIKFLNDDSLFMSFKSVQFAYTTNSLGKRQIKFFGNYTHICEGAKRAALCVKYKYLNPRVYSIKV